jgi:hypothetical protein
MVGLLAILALVVFGTPAFAQGAGVGVKIGPTFTTLDLEGPDFEGLEGKTGWQGGIFFGGNRRGTIGVMGEVNYARRNAEAPADEGGGKVKLSYIQVPVFLRANFGSRSTEGVAGYFIVGPFVSLKLDAKQGDEDLDEEVEGADAGIIVGGGVEITRFIIELRGDFGMRQINSPDLSDTSKIKTRSFAILFGLRFN